MQLAVSSPATRSSSSSLQGPLVRRTALWTEAQTTHCPFICLSTGCEELLKDVLSVESAGTLPCSPDIPDCVEQVRAPASAPAAFRHPLHLHLGSALEGLEGLGFPFCSPQSPLLPALHQAAPALPGPTPSFDNCSSGLLVLPSLDIFSCALCPVLSSRPKDQNSPSMHIHIGTV